MSRHSVKISMTVEKIVQGGGGLFRVCGGFVGGSDRSSTHECREFEFSSGHIMHLLYAIRLVRGPDRLY